MIPIKPLDDGSRRSSILKLPKQRQPFQTIVESPGLPEVKPAHNSKRRVSFAEKKRVKEFCDSVDQGIVWDSTYEESDSSNLKNQRQGSLDPVSITHSTVQQSSVLSIDKENQSVNFYKFEEVHCELSAMPQFEKDTLTNKNISLSTSSQIVFRETICDNETMTFTKVLSSVPQNDKENIYVHSCEDERSNKSNENLSMEFTEAVPNSIYLNQQQLDNNQESSMELTLELDYENSPELNNETKLNEMSMEITSAISLEPLKNPNLSMEMTSAIPSMPIIERNHFQNFSQESSGHIFNNVQSVVTNNNLVSQNESMEFTNVIQRNFEYKNDEINISTNKNQQSSQEFEVVNSSSMSKHFNVPNILQIQQNDENNKIFRNSMEFTAIVPASSQNENVFQSKTLSVSTDSSLPSDIVDSIPPSTSTILLKNGSTESININEISQEKNQDQIDPSSSSRTFQNKSCELNVDNSVSTNENSFDTSDAGHLTNKRRKLSNLDMEKITDAKNESIFQNSNRNDFEDILRRSEDSITSMEITKPILQYCNPETDTMTVNIIQINTEESKTNQENDFITEARVSPVSVPSSSPSRESLLNMSETEVIEISNVNEKNEDTDNFNSQMDNVNVLLHNDEQVSKTSEIEIVKYPFNQPVISKVNSTNLENSNENTTIQGHNNILRTDENELIEHVEPPSFLFFDESNQIENSAQQMSCNIELDGSKKVLNTKRSCGANESKNLINTNRKQDEMLEKIRRTFVMSKENETQYGGLIPLIGAARNILKKSDSRRTFVINKETDTHFERLTQITEDVKSISCKYKCVFTKINEIEQKIESTVKSLKKIRVPEKTVHHKNIHISNENSKIIENTEDEPKAEEPFHLLVNNIKSYAERNDCIWSIRSLDEEKLSIDYISKSLVVVIKLNRLSNNTFRDIKSIQIKSLIAATSNDLMQMVHDLIIKKLRPELLIETYKLFDDIIPLLEEIAKEVKLALDFMFELQKLKNLHLMEVNSKRVSFMTRTKRMSIILKLSLNIKPFDEIEIDDVDVVCFSGSINTSVVKQLIVNVKKDHKFLRRFINDVKDYVEIMEESEEISKNTTLG